MKRIFFTWVTALVLLLGLASVASAQPPGNYHFKLIAETGPGFLNLGQSVSLNNRGTVSFFAETAPNIRGVFAGNADEPLITIAADTGRNALGETSINDLGVVAFTTGAREVLVGSGGPTTPVFTPDWYSATGVVSLNNNGSVVFETSSWNSRNLTYASRGTVTFIDDSGMYLGGADSLVINNRETAVFGPAEWADPPKTLKVTTAGAPATVLLTATTGDKPFDLMTGAVINDRGTVAFVGRWGDGKTTGIYTFANGQLAQLPQFDSYGVRNISMNNNDAIAFQAGLSNIGDGIFTGPDLVADKVILRGDELFNSMVTDVALFRQGFNDRGEVVFWASLQDGRQVIVRAKPKKDKD